ncbi:uncharacterized protein [Venturia canescens]|uniref:uncharacterized protein n=1 Tax=Venturia canescens TaxID=32260 RepID=UPI001C9CB138|nr:uncharacterized protein LOC122418389 [Venturia canescens]
MRVRIFMLMGLYCVWQIKRNEATSTTSASSVTKDEGSGTEKERLSGREKDHLFPPPLVSPYGGTLKLLMGISVPISLAKGRSMSFGVNFQFQFPIPQNATFFTHYFDAGRGRGVRRWRRMTANVTSLPRPRDRATGPDETRATFYRSLELAIERWGGNGRECLMKSICEVAETPLKDQGLVGQLFDVILTPEHLPGSGFNTRTDYDDYLRASLTGMNGSDCSLNYPACPEGFGLLDRVSTLDYI